VKDDSEENLGAYSPPIDRAAGGHGPLDRKVR
jgi:hypothetical protein